MADPSFFVKVGIECGIGIFTKCAAEVEKRKGNFHQELDLVTANVIMAIIADFMLVWLPAPTMSFANARSCRSPLNAISRFFACCPENAFQKVPEGASKTSHWSDVLLLFARHVARAEIWRLLVWIIWCCAKVLCGQAPFLDT
jgi:hypothetical protein